METVFQKEKEKKSPYQKLLKKKKKCWKKVLNKLKKC